MKKVVAFGSVFLLIAVAIFALKLPNLSKKPAPQVQLEKQEEAQPQGPLSFWCGEIIIGEGPQRGKIELVAALGKESVVLTADKEGICKFDPIPGMEPGEMHILLRQRGYAPLVSVKQFEEGKEIEMHPVYGPSRALQEGKISPFIAPHITPPAERTFRQKGQKLEGFTWCVRSYDMQVYGKERPKQPGIHYGSNRIELTPLVKAKLEPFEVNLVRHYFTDERLAEMAKEDRKFDTYAQKNGLTEFKTSVGTFRVVYCFGRHSTESDAKNAGGWGFSTLQLPNGKWMNNFLGIKRTIELDGQVYLACRHHILQWISNEKLQCVVTFEGLDGKWAPYISPSDTRGGLLGSRYLPVNKSNQSDFGGLLEYRDGTWKFHQYDGDYESWADDFEEAEGHIILILFNGWDHQKGKPAQRIRFDHKQGTFTDL